ncbi:site-specific integrase [Glutamicibacter endophyticus]
MAVARIEDRWFRKDKTPKSTHGVGDRWMAIWNEPDGTRRSKKFATRSHAQEHLRVIAVQQSRGEYVSEATQQLLVEELLTEWVSTALHWKASTREAIASNIRTHIVPKWGSWQIGQIRRRDVQRWIAEVNLAPRTVETIHGHFHAFLQWCVSDNLIATNPATNVNLPKGRKREHIFLTVDQVRHLAGAIDPHYSDLVWFLSVTGLRIGEAIELRAKDLDIARRRISVNRSTIFVGGRHPVVGPPKNGTTRSVALPSKMMTIVEKRAANVHPQSLMFQTQRGHQIRPNNFKRRQFDEAVEKANVASKRAGRLDLYIPTDLRVHDLRHTASSLLVRSGASVKAVQRMLGHATAAITLDVYAGLFEDDLDDVAHRLDSLI